MSYEIYSKDGADAAFAPKDGVLDGGTASAPLYDIRIRHDDTAGWATEDPILAAGEPAVVLDSGQPAELVLGDGVTAMADLRAAVWDDDARLAAAATATQPGDLATVATTGAYANLSGKPALGTAAATAATDYASAAQGVKADSASQPGHAHAGGDITSGTVAYARLPVGTAASTLAAGDDSRITGAAQKSANLSDLASASTARTNLGLGTAATTAATAYATAAQGTAADAALAAAAAPELIRDTIATALVAGTNVTITPNDGADTITIAASGGGGGPVFSVMDFGAKGDGTDDAAAIQAAINALPNGGTVFFPRGSYRVNSTLTIAADGVTLKGDPLGSTLAYYGAAGTACITTDPAAVRRNGGIEELFVSCITAGATALKLDNAYRWIMRRCRFESQNGTTGIGIDIVGSLTKSCNLSEFHSCSAWGSLAALQMNDNVNGIRFIGGVLEGPGYAVNMPGTNSNMGSNMFIGTAIQSEGTNTAGVIITMGQPSGTPQCAYNSFIGCRIETAAATTIQNNAQAWYNQIIGGSVAVTTTIVDSVTTAGAQLMTFYAANVDYMLPKNVRTKAMVVTNHGGTAAVTLGNGGLLASGSNASQNLYLRSKGSSSVTVNEFANDPTGGLTVFSGGATSVPRAVLGAGRGATLYPPAGGEALRVIKNGGPANPIVRIDENGAIKWGDVTTNVVDVSVGRSAAGVLAIGGPAVFQTTAPAAGAGEALPATPAGYLKVNINGTDRFMPYY